MDDMASVGLQVDSRSVRTASGDLDKFAGAGDKAGGSAGKATTAFTSMARALGALVTIAAAVKMLKSFVSATVENERVQAQLAAAIASTGGAAAKSVADLNKHAAALQKITNYGDETINAMQGVLLTFTQIKGDQFDAATVAILDMSQALGKDLQASALQVGKALNDPVKGMAALAESGIQFTEAQKDMVKAMVAANDTIGAQTIILAELDRQFGGSAVAARDTLGGALASLRNAWGDVFELGGPAAESLRATINGLIVTITDPAFVTGLQNIGALLFNMAGAVLKLVGFFGSLVGAIQGAIGRFVSFVTIQRQSQVAIDNVTLAMGDEIGQANALFTLMGTGQTMTLSAALATLSQAEAHMRAAQAIREQKDEIIALQMAMLTIDYQRQLEGLRAIREGTDAYERMEQVIASTLVEMVSLQAIQRSTNGDFAAAALEVERIREAIANAVDGMVTFDGEIVTAAELTARLANIAAGIRFDAAISSAAALAAQLGVSVGLARALANVGAGRGDGGTVVFDPRDPRYDAGAAALARTAITMQDLADNAGNMTNAMREAEKALAGGAEDGAAGAAAQLADELEKATTFAGGFNEAM